MKSGQVIRSDSHYIAWKVSLLIWLNLISHMIHLYSVTIFICGHVIWGFTSYLYIFYSSTRFLFLNNEFLQVPKSFLLEVLGKDRVTKFVIQEILNSTMADYAKKASLPSLLCFLCLASISVLCDSTSFIKE